MSYRVILRDIASIIMVRKYTCAGSILSHIIYLLENKHKCSNEPPALLVKHPKKQTHRKTTRKKNFFDKEIQLISTNQCGIFF